MTYDITLNIDKHTDYDGYVTEARKEKFHIPFGLFQTVWYAFRKRNKWAVRKSIINSVWVTNMCGVRLDNDWLVCESEFYLLFCDEEDAINYCLKMNEQSKVKVYNKDNWK